MKDRTFRFRSTRPNRRSQGYYETVLCLSGSIPYHFARGSAVGGLSDGSGG